MGAILLFLGLLLLLLFLYEGTSELLSRAEVRYFVESDSRPSRGIQAGIILLFVTAVPLALLLEVCLLWGGWYLSQGSSPAVKEEGEKSIVKRMLSWVADDIAEERTSEGRGWLHKSPVLPLLLGITFLGFLSLKWYLAWCVVHLLRKQGWSRGAAWGLGVTAFYLAYALCLLGIPVLPLVSVPQDAPWFASGTVRIVREGHRFFPDPGAAGLEDRPASFLLDEPPGRVGPDTTYQLLKVSSARGILFGTSQLPVIAGIHLVCWALLGVIAGKRPSPVLHPRTEGR